MGKKVDAVIAAINKKAGKNVVNKLGKVKDNFIAEFIPTPSLEVNNALGGGFKRGTIVEVAGEQSSGKTSFLIETIAMDQKQDPDAVWGWFETEHSFDWDYAVGVHGVDPDRLVVWEVEDEGAEKGLDTLDALIRTREVKGLVINSVAGLTPKKEFEGEMADQNVGLQARMMSKLMRKIVGITGKSKALVVFINQFREKVGVMHGDPRTTTGGRALAFFATQRVDFNKVKIEKADGFTEDEAVKISYRVRKNRAVYRNPFVKGSFIAVFGEGIDRVGEIARFAPDLGIVEKKGSWIYYPTKDTPAVIDGVDMKFQSTAKFMEFLEDHPDTLKQFTDMVMEGMKNGIIASEQLSDEEMAEIDKEQKAADEFMKDFDEEPAEVQAV